MQRNPSSFKVLLLTVASLIVIIPLAIMGILNGVVTFRGTPAPITTTPTLPVSGGGTGVATFPIAGFVTSYGGTLPLYTVGSIDLTTNVSNILPATSGGTNSGAPLNNDRLMMSFGGQIIEADPLLNGQVMIGSTGTTPIVSTLTGTPKQIAVANGAGSITLSTPQDIDMDSTPTFEALTLTAPTNQLVLGTTQTTALSAVTPTASRVYTIPDAGVDASFVLTTGPTNYTNGQVLIGGTAGNTLSAATLTAGSGVIIANGVNSITISTTAVNLTNGTLPIGGGGTNSGTALNNNRIMVSLLGKIVESGPLTNGQVVIGSTGATPVIAALTGTGNQVIVTNGPGSIALSTPQNIATTSTPTFASETLTSTTNQLILGTIQTTTINSVAPVSSRTYTIPDAGAAAKFVLTTGSTSYTDGQVLIGGTTGNTLSAATLTAGNGITITNAANSIGIAANFSNFNGILPVVNGGTNSNATLNNNRVMVSAGGQIVESGPLTNGQIIIGSTGAAPVVAAITGTANQVIVTNGPGSIGLSTPQNIATTSTPTFASETLTATTNQLILGTTQTTTISSVAPASSRTYTIPDAGAAAKFVLTTGSTSYTNGQVLIGGTAGNTLVAGTITGTLNQIAITNADNSITLSTPQNISTTSTPTFASETLTATTNQLILGTTQTTTISSIAPASSRVYTIPDAGGSAKFVLTTGSTSYTNGQVLIGGSSGNTLVAGTITGTSNQVTVTNADNSITLSTPQNISTTSTPTFASETLTATTNQLVLGTTQTTTISSIAPAASRFYTIPDAGTNASFVLTTGSTSYTDGQILIGSTSGNTLTPATLTAGTGISITNSAGSVTITFNAFNLSGVNGTLPVSDGGTNISSYTIGDLLYASDTQVLSKLADVAIGNALISGGVAAAPSWGKIGLATHISGTLPVSNGGTNIVSYTIGDLLYASGATTLSKLPDVATGSALISGGVGVAPSWGQVSLTTGVSGTLPVANGGTNIASYTIGDLLYASGATTLSKLADVATGSALISGGVGVAPSWGQVSLTTGVSGTLPVANGGTNIASYAIGDILYASASTTLSKLADVATGNALISGGLTTAPAWGKIGLATHVSGTLPVANGGTNIASYTIGDILYASASGVLSKLADVATGNALISGGVGVAPSWGQIGLTTHVSGTLQVANGGTGLTGYTTGDILVAFSSTTLTRLADVATGNVLVSGGVGSMPSWSQLNLNTQVAGTLPAANGGTGWGAGTYAVGDILYASSTSFLSKLSDVATGSALISGGVGAPPSWGQIGLTTHVSGILPVANGGTNIASYVIGDLLYASASGVLSRLADVALGSALISGGVGAAPSWGQVSLTTGVTGTLPAANGGTGQGSYAIGDLLYASTSSALSKLPDVATGSALISGGIGVAPSWGQIGLATHVSGTLPVANGGTNIASYAIGDILYASGATTLSKLADVATGNALISGGVTTAPSWGKIDLAAHITGTLPVANGGTNIASYAIGDILYASGATALSKLADVALGSVLISGGVTTAPSWSSTPTVTSATLKGTTNQLVLGVTQTTTITSPAPAVSRTYTIPDAGAAANFVLTTGSASYTNGQVLIGATTGNTLVAGTITGTTSQITVTNAANSITLSTPQNIATTSTPTFASETLTAVTNQLVLGTTQTTTISSVAPASSRTYTIPDAGAAANFVLTTGSTSYTDGQVLIGATTGNTLSAATLTAGAGITITNAANSITVASSVSGTEYTTAGTYTYTIPAGTKFLYVVAAGAGGGGGSSNSAPSGGGSGGGAGLVRFVTIPVDSDTSATVVVGAGGVSGVSSATATTITLGSRVITWYAGGNGASSTGIGQIGGGGGSAGTGGNGGSGTTAGVAGAAGANTRSGFLPANPVSGLIGATGPGGGNGAAGSSALQTAELIFIGGSGGSGSTANTAGATGGSSAMNYAGGATTAGDASHSAGGGGGASGLAAGGAAGTSVAAGQAGTKGSGGGGAMGLSGGQSGGVGGPGYVHITPM